MTPPLDAGTGRTARRLDLDYRQLCQQLLGHHPRPGNAIAELCLFHLWLAGQASERWLEEELGGTLPRLLDARFPLYDRFVALGRQDDDPLGLRAATVALACQLYAAPSAEVIARLQAHTRQIFNHLSAG